jgi:hypothetical protein
MKRLLTICSLLLLSNTALANDIYITQIGDGLDLDIVQDGSGNEIGDSTTDLIIKGDDMTFSITQTGDNNDIAATINGADYSGTWDFFGNTNEVTLNCDSLGTAGAGNCEDVTLNIDGDGDDNTYTFNIGETSDAGGSEIVFDVDGDNNVTNFTLDGVDADIDIVMDNSASLATTSTGGDEGNAITINSSGGAALAGHVINLNITGGGSTYDITQSGTNQNTIEATFSGDSQDVDITQQD